jgi:hypothetical protein
MAGVVPLFDGSRKLSDVAQTAVSGEDPETWRREVYKLAYRLLRMGALAVVDHPGAKAGDP